MAASGKKKGKVKGKTLNLNEFLSAGDDTPPAGTSYVYSTKKSWAEEAADADGDYVSSTPWADSGSSLPDRISLPTAPKSAQQVEIDKSKLPPNPPYTIYLGNLPFDCAAEDIRKFLSAANCNVSDVRLPTEGDTQRLKGFGYAEVDDMESLYKALSLSNTQLQNRRIRVDLASQAQTDGKGGDRGYDKTPGDWRRSDNSNRGDWNQGGDRYGGSSRPSESDRERWRDRGGTDNPDRGGGSYGGRDRGYDGDRGYNRDRGGGFERNYDRGGGGFERNYDRDRGGSDGRGFGREWDRDRGGGGGYSRGGGSQQDYGYDRRNDRGSDRGYDRGGPDRGYDRGYDRGPDRGYDRGGPDRGYDRGGPDRGYDRGGPDRGYDRGGPDRGYDRGGPDRGYDRSGPDRGYDRGYDRGGRDQGYDRGGPDRGYGPSRGGFDRDEGRDDWRRGEDGPGRRGGENDYGPSEKEPPRERKKLVLQKRTQPIEQNPAKAVSSSSIFGGAKPVDTAAKEREIEERLERERKQMEQQKQSQTMEKEVPRKDGPDHTSARVRRDSERSEGREGRTRHSSSGSGRGGPRPVIMRRESERSNDEEVFHKDDQAPVSPTPTSPPPPKTPTSPRQEDVKLVPAPPPKENAWAKRSETVTAQPPSSAASSRPPSHAPAEKAHAPADKPHSDSGAWRDGDRPRGGGRGGGGPSRGRGQSHRSETGGRGGRGGGGGGGGARHDGERKASHRDKPPPPMPKYEEPKAKDWSDSNKFSSLLEDELGNTSD